MHINGLIDPLSIILSQDKRPITMGRHDLATMPLIGWITRRMGNQPVIRRAEQASGIVGPEYSKSINHRTLLTMSHCIAGGHGAVVMPEGKSHQDSKLHHLRTGALRFSLNATLSPMQRKSLLRPSNLWASTSDVTIGSVPMFTWSTQNHYRFQ